MRLDRAIGALTALVVGAVTALAFAQSFHALRSFAEAQQVVPAGEGTQRPLPVERSQEVADHDGKTAPSLYDLRNLFQVNVEEGRHLWAMVYLLHSYFGRDGRDEADALLDGAAGDTPEELISEALRAAR